MPKRLKRKIARNGPPPKPWERQPDESWQAFEAFVCYCNLLSDRTVPLVSRKLRKSIALLHRWSSKYRWVDRVAEWDSYRESQSKAAEVSEIRKMARRHAELAVGLQQLGTEELKAWITKVKNAQSEAARTGKPMDPSLSSKDVTRLIDTGTKLERLSRGEPETIVRTDVTMFSAEQLKNLSDKELDVLHAVVQKLGGPSAPDAGSNPSGKGPSRI